MPKVRFSAIGLNHGHIYGMCSALIGAGAEFVSFFATENDLIEPFQKKFPQAKLARSEQEILEDTSIQLIASASVPCDRAPLGIKAMQHGKDFFADKPGITSLEQLADVRKIQAETKRIFSIFYGERLESKSTVKAGELIKAGAIGKVVQTLGLGPHRTNIPTRPPWFFQKKTFGGILCDIASHQADQFLFLTNSADAEVVASQVANYNHPQFPNFEDFGDMILRNADGVSGYIRVDWFTPAGLATWGDAKLIVIGTEGYMELRKNVDIAGRPGANHLFLVDNKKTEYIDCQKQELPFASQFLNDIVDRTETAMTQAHCFKAMELALKAQASATMLGNIKGA